MIMSDWKGLYFLPYQRRWLEDDAPLRIIEKARQIGMSTTDAYDSVKKVIEHGARLDVWVSTRDELQARLYLRDCAVWAKFFSMQADWSEEGSISEDGYSTHVLEFKSGRRIHCVSSNPNALAGKRGHVKLDEFALHQDQRLLYHVAKPLTQWGGQLSIISTHRGPQTLFNQIIRDIRERGNPMGWSLHSVPLEKAVQDGLVEKINEKSGGGLERSLLARTAPEIPLVCPELREAWSKRIRQQCVDEEQWLQEYCCVPADESTAFISFELITACEEARLELITPEQLQASLSSDRTDPSNPSDPATRVFFLGVDVARKHDLCVLDLGEKIGDVVWDRVRIELRDKTFSEIEAELYRLLKLRQVKRACIDATGMGLQLAERARKKFGWKVEPVTFTAAVKEELAFALRAEMQDKRLRIVADDKLRSDLRGIKKEVSTAGHIRFAGDAADSHCDRFWAKALRQAAARQPSARTIVIG